MSAPGSAEWSRRMTASKVRQRAPWPRRVVHQRRPHPPGRLLMQLRETHPEARTVTATQIDRVAWHIRARNYPPTDTRGILDALGLITPTPLTRANNETVYIL